ncbi:M48 family metallopeptidase [Actinospica sp. MGRD01-02]|uniref:M48 family metallopeptidase n=2 Tax=Actinospica acidithermotolerans TaxID=2828514 RepID=A0A941E7X1_9ACTN|nr:M48 family metallopeptidase [Actinospica acidithermotolerans]
MAVMLLIGFYVMGLGLIAVVVGINILMCFSRAPVTAILALPFTAAAFFLVGRAFYASLRLRPREIAGVAVPESEQPAVWSAIRTAAAAAGTAPPDCLWIDSRFNASVYEQTRWLGLRPGQRHLVVGAPMLVALSPARLDAVLAHEFGHFAHRDTHLLPIVMRGRSGLAAALRTASFFKTANVSNGRWLVTVQILVVRLIHAYAVGFLKTTQKISRSQEYLADRISAELCGRDTAAAMLSDLPAYGAAYHFYRARFADVGTGLGLVPMPEELFAGFGRMLDESRWQTAVEAQRPAPPVRKPTPFDSHPPIADRVAALRALPSDGRPEDKSSDRAVDRFDDAAVLLAAVARSEAQRADKHAVDWDTLADAVARARARNIAGPLIAAIRMLNGTPATLAGFFDRVEAGQMEVVLHRMLTPAQVGYTTSNPAVALEIGARALASALPAWINAELAEAGLVRWKHSWAGAPVLDAQGVPDDLNEALAALLGAEPSQAGPAAAALRDILKGAGVPV